MQNFTQAMLDSGRAPRTVQLYTQELERFAAWFQQTNGEPLTPRALTPTDAREYRQHLQRRQLAPETINLKLAALRAYAAWAIETEQIESDPLRHMRNVEEQKPGPHYLDKQKQAALWREVERAAAAAHSEAGIQRARRDLAIVAVLLHTGLRVGELCALELNAVQLSERSRTDEKGQVIIRHGKGEKKRVVPLNDVARRELAAWLKVRPAVKNAALFVNRLGSPLKTGAVNRLLEGYGRRAKVAVTPHMLRHTFAKSLIDAGVSLEKVAALMGHSKLETTRIYVLPNAHDLEKAVEVLET